MGKAKRALGALAVGGLLLVGLTACTAESEYAGTSISNPMPGAWFQSSRGDVYCSYPQENRVHDVSCQWSSLTASGAHTSAKSPALQIELVTTKQGTIECGFPTDSGYSTETPSCDWTTLTPFVKAAR